MDQEFSGKEKYGDEENAYDFESDGPDDAYESVIKEDDSKKSLSDIARELMLSQKFEKIANEMEPFDYSDEFEYADNFLNELLSDYDNEDFYDDLFDEVKNEYGDIILSMYGRPDDDDEDMYESVIKENMCEQCGMTETLCECWMKEEVEEDLQESFKKEKERITEMFNRFKKYN
jgi:predicted CopG family antitoxin